MVELYTFTHSEIFCELLKFLLLFVLLYILVILGEKGCYDVI